MDEVLIVRVCDITDVLYDFNGYMYRLVTCEAENDGVFSTLLPVENPVSAGDVISVEKCKLVRIDYEAKNIVTAVRIDRFEIKDADTNVSPYFNIPFLGLIKRHPESKVFEFGPDKIKFLKVRLQMRDPDRKPFVIPLLGFEDKAKLLDSFGRFKIIKGLATLKHCKNSTGYELVLISATEYKK